MKQIALLALVVSALACETNGTLQDTLVRRSDPAGVDLNQSAQFIVGRLVELPMCVWNNKPMGASVSCNGGPCTFDPATGLPTADMYGLDPPASLIFDWGGGNAYYEALFGACHTHNMPYPAPGDAVLVRSMWGTGQTVIAHVTGFVQHLHRALVRGQIHFHNWVLPSIDGGPATDPSPEPIDRPVIAALQTQGDDGVWRDAVATMSGAKRDVLEVEGEFEPNTAVRMEVRVQRQPTDFRVLVVRSVRLFGAECFPVENMPGACVE
jgi:hypothetical protein